MMAAETCPVMKGGVTCFWETMWRKLDNMRQLWQLCDVTLLSEDKEMFMAHSPVLAASSRLFHSYFIDGQNGIIEVQPDKGLLLRTVQRDILQITLDFIYGKSPTTVADFEKLMTGSELLQIEGARAYCKQKILELSMVESGVSIEIPSGQGRVSSIVRLLNRPSELGSETATSRESRDSSVIMYKPQGSPPQSANQSDSRTVCPNTQGAEDIYNIPATMNVMNRGSFGRSSYNQFNFVDSPHTSLTQGHSPISPAVANRVHPDFETCGYGASEQGVAQQISNSPDWDRGIGFSTPLGLHIPPPLDLHHAVMADMSLNDLAKNIECPHLRRLQQSGNPVEDMDTGAQELQRLDHTPDTDDHSLASDRVFCDMTPTSPEDSKALNTFHQLRRGLSSSEDLDDDTDSDIDGYSGSEFGYRKRRKRRLLSGFDSGDSALDSSHNLASSEDSLDIDADLNRYRHAPAFLSPDDHDDHDDDDQFTSPFSSASKYDTIKLNPSDQSGIFAGQSSSEGPITSPQPVGLQLPVQLPTQQEDFSLQLHSADEADLELQIPAPPEEATPFVDLSNEKIVANLKMDGISKSFVCLVHGCDYSNKHMDYMRSHLYHRHNMGSPTHPCKHCAKAYFSEGQLNNHVKRTHDKLRTDSTSNSVHCVDCDLSFKSVYKLQTHQLKVHGKGKLFTCDRCAFKSPRKKDVQAHMLSQHGEAPPGVRVYSCPFCEYKCIDRNRYEEHEAMHTGEQKHQCTECSKSYTTRRGLRTHQKYHSEERPYHCEECGARFKVRSKLKDHVKLVHTHPGVKPYQCGYCEHRTALRGNCNQHIKKHHPGLPVSVIDHLASQRKSVKDYDYAEITGAGIQECTDVRAARWASIGNSANFFPPAGPVGVIDVDASGSESLANLVGAVQPLPTGAEQQPLPNLVGATQPLPIAGDHQPLSIGGEHVQILDPPPGGLLPFSDI